MKRTSIILFILVIFSLTACSGTGALPSTPDGTKGIERVSIPTAEVGKAVVTGILTNKNNNAPISSQLVRLAKIFGEGKESVYVFNESADPGSYTEADGTFTISGVDPGLYAIILVDNNGNYSPINENEDKIATVNVTADQVVDVGPVLFDYPAP